MPPPPLCQLIQHAWEGICCNQEGLLCTLVEAVAGPEGMLGTALGLRSCSFTAETLAASAGGSPPGTNSAAVGLRAPLLSAGFSPRT